MPGAQLPSVRALAQQLTVNPNTVAKAYAELTADGLIESRQGIGVFVLQPEQRLSDGERERRLNEATRHFISAVVTLGYAPEEILDRVGSELLPLAMSSTGTG